MSRSKAQEPAVKPTLVFVAAQKGGVGKTTTARLLMHWLQETRRSHLAFDAEFPRGSLKRFYPERTEIVDMDQVADQMRVFDAVAGARDNTVFLLDLRAGSFFKILDTLTELGIFQEARAGTFNLMFLHVLGGSVESIDEVRATLPRFEGARHVVVRNPANGADLSLWDGSDVRETFERQGGVEIKIPPLHPLAYQAIDQASASFQDFVDNTLPGGGKADHSYTLRAYTRNWLLLSMGQLDRLKL